MKPRKEDLNTKYRPKTFDEVAGNEEVVKTIKNYVASCTKRVFLLHGPPGCGKTTLARLIAKEISCAESEIYEYNAANTRGIDTVREIIDGAEYEPLWGSVKVFLLDESHCLTKEAQEAFLKFLEEPPKHVWIILCTTEPEKLLPTIHSRAKEFELFILQPGQIEKRLREIVTAEELDVSDIVFENMSNKAQGDLRKAINELEDIRVAQKPPEKEPETKLAPDPEPQPESHVTTEEKIVQNVEAKVEAEAKYTPEAKLLKEKIDKPAEEKPAETPKSEPTEAKPPEPLKPEPEHELKLKYLVSHLQHFAELKEALGLYGEGYDIVEKAVWYSVISQVAQKQKANLTPQTEEDFRLNFVYQIHSAGGKEHIVEFLKACGISLAEPTETPGDTPAIIEEKKKAKVVDLDYYNIHELIGTSRKEKEEVTTTNPDGSSSTTTIIREVHYPGFLAEDLILLNDIRDELLIDKSTQNEKRHYLLKAANPYGNNEVMKRLAEFHTPVRFMPHCLIHIFFQTGLWIADKIIKEGFFRRFIWIMPDIPDVKKSDLEDKISAKTSRKDMTESFCEYLKQIQAYIKDTTATGPIVTMLKPEGDAEDAGMPQGDTQAKLPIERLLDLWWAITNYFQTFPDPKIRRYGRIFIWPSGDTLLKMASLLAISNGRTDITVEDIERAFMDCVEFLETTIDFLSEAVDTRFKNEMSSLDREMLDWLRNKNALKEETAITIRDYEEKIMVVFFKFSEPEKHRGGPDYLIVRHRARRIKEKHRKNHWIKTRDNRSGESKETKVWLEIDEKNLGRIDINDDGWVGENTQTDLWKEYDEITRKYEKYETKKVRAGRRRIRCGRVIERDFTDEVYGIYTLSLTNVLRAIGTLAPSAPWFKRIRKFFVK